MDPHTRTYVERLIKTAERRGLTPMQVAQSEYIREDLASRAHVLVLADDSETWAAMLTTWAERRK